MKKLQKLALSILITTILTTNQTYAAMQDGVWINDLKSLFSQNKAIILAINIRTFNANDKNGNDIIELEKSELRGNFVNAIQRLDEIREMGINTLHILPITPTGKIKAIGTAGSLYAISDFTQINPQLDDTTNNISVEKEAKNFIKECHKRNIRVIVDLPSCGSYDLFLSKPELFEKEENGQPIVPADWTDVRMFKVNNKDGSLNIHLLEEYKKFVDLMLSIGVDGIRADVATCKTEEFWQRLISYTNLKDPQFLFLAEASEKWTQPITKNAPFTPSYKLLNAGFDGWYASFFDFKNWTNQSELENSLKLIADIKRDYKLKNQSKAVIGSFATHDEVSPIITGGAPFANMIFWLQATLPLNSYFVDGIQTGDSYQYQYANQKATDSETDDDYYYVHKGQFDIFNYSRKPGAKNKLILAEFVRANQFKKSAIQIINNGEYNFLRTNNKNIFAYIITKDTKSILVVINKNLIYNAEVEIKIKGFNEEDTIVPIVFNNPPQVNKNRFKLELLPGDTNVFLLETIIKSPKSTQKEINITPLYR